MYSKKPKKHNNIYNFNNVRFTIMKIITKNVLLFMHEIILKLIKNKYNRVCAICDLLQDT